MMLNPRYYLHARNSRGEACPPLPRDIFTEEDPDFNYPRRFSRVNVGRRAGLGERLHGYDYEAND